MQNPIIVVAPNGRNYACFKSVKAAHEWAINFPRFRRQWPVRVGTLCGFAL